eukprot:evm.model.scf_1492.4 EVM.evm.TU.scf_1492.4   scf_1492:20992-25532(+)
MDQLPPGGRPGSGGSGAGKLFTERGVYGSPVSNDSPSPGADEGRSFGFRCRYPPDDSDSASSDLEEEAARGSAASSEEGEKILPEPTRIKPGESQKPLRGAVVTMPRSYAPKSWRTGGSRDQEAALHPGGSVGPGAPLTAVFPQQTTSKASSNILGNPLYDGPQPTQAPMSAKSLFKTKLKTTAPTAPLQIKRADLRPIVSPELQVEERRELLDRDGELCHPTASQGWKVYPGIVAGKDANELSCGLPVRQPLYGDQGIPDPPMPDYLNQEVPEVPEPRVSSRYLTQETPEPLCLEPLEPRVSSRYLTQETPEPLSLDTLSPRNDVINSSSPVHEGEPDGSSTETGAENKRSEQSESSAGKENLQSSESFAFDNRFNRLAKPGLMTGSGGLFHVGRSMRPEASTTEGSRQQAREAEKQKRPLQINTGAISHALNQNWPKGFRNPRSEGQTGGKRGLRIPKASDLPQPDGASIGIDCVLVGQQPIQATLDAEGYVVSRVPRLPASSGPVPSRTRKLDTKRPQCADEREAMKSKGQPKLSAKVEPRTGSPESPQSRGSLPSESSCMDSDDTCATPESVFGVKLHRSRAGRHKGESDDSAGQLTEERRRKRRTKRRPGRDNEYSVVLKINMQSLLEFFLLLIILAIATLWCFTASRCAGEGPWPLSCVPWTSMLPPPSAS